MEATRFGINLALFTNIGEFLPFFNIKIFGVFWRFLNISFVY